jgi:hypothetical protein
LRGGSFIQHRAQTEGPLDRPPVEEGGAFDSVPMLNLDTHILLHALDGPPRASRTRTAAGRRRMGHLSHRALRIESCTRGGRILHGLDYEPLARALDRLRIRPMT